MFLCHRVPIDAPCQSTTENIKAQQKTLFLESLFKKDRLPQETSAQYVYLDVVGVDWNSKGRKFSTRVSGIP